MAYPNFNFVPQANAAEEQPPALVLRRQDAGILVNGEIPQRHPAPQHVPGNQGQAPVQQAHQAHHEQKVQNPVQGLPVIQMAMEPLIIIPQLQPPVVQNQNNDAPQNEAKGNGLR